MKNKLPLFLLFILYTLTLLPAQSPNEQEELRKFASQLIEALDPEAKMSEQEKAQLVDKTVQETMQMDNYLKSLPESERLAEEKKIEDAVSYLMSDESPIKDMFDANQKSQPETEEQPANQEVNTEKDTEEPVQINKDIKDLKNLLEAIAERISSLLKKSRLMPRVSQEKAIETLWIKLKNSLALIESILKIIMKKDDLLSLLQDNSNKELKNNLLMLKNSLLKETKFIVPDTAGLTISFDEEEDSDNIEFITAQKTLKIIIDSLQKTFNETDIANKLINFIKSNAVTELQKNPELSKKIDDYQTASGSQANYIPSTSGGYRPSPGYYPPSPGFSGFDFPLNPNDYYNPSNVSQNLAATNQGAPEQKDKKYSGSTGSGSKGQKAKKGDGDKAKPEKPKKEKPKPEKKKNPAIDKYIQDLQSTLKELNESYKSADFKAQQNLLQSPEEENILSQRNFGSNLIKLDRSYDKANKLAYNFKTALSINKDSKHYKKEAKNIYHQVNLENEFKIFNEYKESFGKTGFPVASDSLKEKLNDIEKKHKEFKDVLEVDKCDIQEDYLELNESIKNISESIEDMQNSVDVETFDKLIMNYNLADKSLKCIKQHVAKDKPKEKEFKNIKESISKHLKTIEKKLEAVKDSVTMKASKEVALKKHKDLIQALN